MNIFRKNHLSLVLLFSILVLNTGCATMGEGWQQKIGTAVGVIAGATIGNGIGGNTGAAISGVVGGFAGSFTSNWLIQYLDEREKQQAIDAAKDVLRNPSKKTARWESRTNPGVGGSATRIHTAQKDCQDIKMRIFKDGKEHITTETFCTDPNSGELVPV